MALHGRVLRAHLVDNHDGKPDDDDDENSGDDVNDDNDDNDGNGRTLTWLRGWGLCSIWRQRGCRVPDNNHQSSNIS